MSRTRHDVLKAFGYYEDSEDPLTMLVVVCEQLADRVLALKAERDAARETVAALEHQNTMRVDTLLALRERADAAERTLARLTQPSADVISEATAAYDKCNFQRTSNVMKVVLRAAVAQASAPECASDA
jgi:hypothetical protein